MELHKATGIYTNNIKYCYDNRSMGAENREEISIKEANPHKQTEIKKQETQPLTTNLLKTHLLAAQARYAYFDRNKTNEIREMIRKIPEEEVDTRTSNIFPAEIKIIGIDPQDEARYKQGYIK